MTTALIDRGRGRVALLVANCAGMVDLVGLPLWVGVLIEWYQFDPMQAGGLATLFLGGIVVASAFLAPRFHKLQGRVMATLGFGLAAVCFLLAWTTQDKMLLTVLHGLGGLSTGIGLSMTHGTIARGMNPHRLMGIAGVALGVFAVIFMGIVPKLLASSGPSTLFLVFGVVMAIASAVCLAAFPTQLASTEQQAVHAPAPLPRAVPLGLLGFALVCLAHGMTMSFIERVGAHHGFTPDQIGTALLTMALISMFPGGLAAWLEHRLSVKLVLFIGPLLHATMVAVLMHTAQLPYYMAAIAALPSLLIFMHTFVFGAMAKMDTSGRTLAAFPGAIMVGSALGPLVGGALVKFSGYSAVAMAGATLMVIAVFCFLPMTRRKDVGWVLQSAR